MEVWNLNELRQLIEAQSGSKQVQKAAPHIDSVHWKLHAAAYHWRTADSAVSAVFESEDVHPMKVFAMMFGSGEKSSEFHEARFVFEANVIACAQCVHSASDILAHLILDALAIAGANEENLGLTEIQKLVPEGELKKRIVRFLGLAKFRYLQDFVNTSKHMQLIDAEYSLDLTGESPVPHGVRFKAFSCRDRLHGVKWGETFIEELKALMLELVEVGLAINEQLRNEQS